LPGKMGQGIAAAHGDHDVGGADGFVGPGFGEFVGDVDASFGHGGDCGGVDLGSGFGSARPCDGKLAGQSVKESEGHLGPAGLVGAQEQYGRLAVAMEAFHFGDGA
jgi:hypothetical protein